MLKLIISFFAWLLSSGSQLFSQVSGWKCSWLPCFGETGGLNAWQSVLENSSATVFSSRAEFLLLLLVERQLGIIYRFLVGACNTNKKKYVIGIDKFFEDDEIRTHHTVLSFAKLYLPKKKTFQQLELSYFS